MTTQLDIERLLDQWLGTTPLGDPDQLVLAVERRIGLQRQRPAWRFRLGLDRAAVAASYVALAGAAVLLLGVIGSLGDPTPTPTSSVGPSASADASPSDERAQTPGPTGDGTSVVLSAGSHRTERFAQAFSYTVPDGWWLSYDTDDRIRLSYGGPLHANSIHVVLNVAPAPLDADGCVKPEIESGPYLATGLVRTLEDADAISASFSEVQFGGVWGYSSDVVVDASWAARCGRDGFGPGRIRTTAYPLAQDAIGASRGGLPETAEAGSNLTLYVLEIGDGRLLLIEIRGSAAFQVEARAVVKAFDFNGGPGVIGEVNLPTPSPLGAGAHRTAEFAVPFTFEVPEGWGITEEYSSVVLERAGGRTNLQLVYDVYPAIRGCMSNDWDRPHSPGDLIAELEDRPGLRTTTRETSLGGHQAWEVRVRADPEPALPTCGPDAPNDIVYIVHWSDSVPFGSGGMPQTFTIVDVLGTTLLVSVSYFGDGTSIEAEVDAIIGSIAFER